MIKQIFFLFVFLFSISLVSSIDCEDGCPNLANNDCLSYGDVEGSNYCDYFTETLVPQKGNKSNCANDFECIDGLSCLYGWCGDSFNEFLNLIISENLSFCTAVSGQFCYNLTQPSNTTLLSNELLCEEGASCYVCNPGLTWNENIGACTLPACSAEPGCLNVTSLNNSITLNYYCSTGSCFECDDNFIWNETSEECEIRPCSTSSSVPGCLNVTSLTNGRTLNRSCSVGSCFACNSGYSWNSNSKTCVSTGYATTTLQLTNNELSVGTQKSVKMYDSIQFTIGGVAYTLEIRSLSPSSASIGYRISPVLNNLVARVGSENRFDLNSDGIQDVNIKLVSITNGQAQISISAIQPTSTTSTPQTTSTTTPTNTRTTTSNDDQEETIITPTKKSANYTLVIVLAVVICIVIPAGVIALKKKRPKSNSSTNTNSGYSSNYQSQ